MRKLDRQYLLQLMNTVPLPAVVVLLAFLLAINVRLIVSLRRRFFKSRRAAFNKENTGDLGSSDARTLDSDDLQSAAVTNAEPEGIAEPIQPKRTVTLPHTPVNPPRVRSVINRKLKIQGEYSLPNEDSAMLPEISVTENTESSMAFELSAANATVTPTRQTSDRVLVSPEECRIAAEEFLRRKFSAEVYQIFKDFHQARHTYINALVAYKGIKESNESADAARVAFSDMCAKKHVYTRAEWAFFDSVRFIEDCFYVVDCRHMSDAFMRKHIRKLFSYFKSQAGQLTIIVLFDHREPGLTIMRDVCVECYDKWGYL